MELAEVVGHLASLRRFPVEPMPGETPGEVLVRGGGIVGDRVYEICDAKTGAVLEVADHPFLLGYSARYLEDLVSSDLDAWARVRTPSGREFPIVHPEWIEELSHSLGRPVALRPRSGEKGDSRLTLLSRPTLRLVERTYGGAVDPIRLRANLLIEIIEGKAFDEDQWVNKEIRIGDTLLQILEPTADCLELSARPGESLGDQQMLEGLIRVRGGNLGVSARVASGHRLRVADSVVLLD